MDIIKGDDFKKIVKRGLVGGSGYLFFGDEDYLKLYNLNMARQAVCSDEGFAFFNDMRISTIDFTPAALIDALMPMPMMSELKIVSVSGISLLDMKPSEIDALCDALETLAEYDYNVLIVSVVSGGLDEGYLPKSPSALLTRLSKLLTPVQFEPVSPSRLVAWAQKHFEHNGVECSDDECRAMIARCGSSMFTLSGEIDKLSYYAIQNGRKRVLPEDIENITCYTIESDAFALTNAVLDGKNEQALAALAVMKYNRVEPVTLLSEISRVICDLILVKSLLADGKTPFEISSIMKKNAYKIKLYVAGASSKSEEKLSRALELCSQTDIALKLSPKGYADLERLLCVL